MQGQQKLSREEYRRQKDLDAARKAGTAAPAVDEEGKAINPHIPEFMSQAPWYLSSGSGPSLKHQKAPGLADIQKTGLQERFQRGAVAGPAATKFRPGACTNCGAMSHQKKDCLERPRKVGAKFTGKNIAADEVIHNSRAGLNGMEGMGDYDVKRDRWDGYDPSSHKRIVEEHEALEQARKKVREEAIDKGDYNESAVKKAAKVSKSSKKKKGKGKAGDESDDSFGSSSESENDDAADEDKYAEGADVAGQKVDTKTRITVRNLRIREDTAKYLMNLDTESAYYDPKTRSMREAPIANVNPEDAKFAGDNFHRHSGGAQEVQRLQMYAWQAEQRGNDVHINANPTQSHLLHRDFLKNKDNLREESATGILEKYGGEKYLERVPRELLSGQTENYVEYSRTGQVIKGQERAKAKSKYDEDLHPGNHTAIWGSWYKRESSEWGFGCCHSTIKASYCVGKTGLEVEKETDVGKLLENRAQLEEARKRERVQEEQEEAESKRRKTTTLNEDDSAGRRRDLGQGDVDAKLDKSKVAELRRQPGKKLPGAEVTEEDMEAYRLERSNKYEDPLALSGVKDGELLPL